MYKGVLQNGITAFTPFTRSKVGTCLSQVRPQIFWPTTQRIKCRRENLEVQIDLATVDKESFKLSPGYPSRSIHSLAFRRPRRCERHSGGSYQYTQFHSTRTYSPCRLRALYYAALVAQTIIFSNVVGNKLEPIVTVTQL